MTAQPNAARRAAHRPSAVTVIKFENGAPVSTITAPAAQIKREARAAAAAPARAEAKAQRAAARTAHNVAATITKMKAWAERNYERGADTMVECWSTDDYARMIADCAGDRREAWAVLRSVAAVYRDRIADARNSAF